MGEKQRKLPTEKIGHRFSGVSYIIPSLLILSLVMVVPILFTFYYSFTSYSVLGDPSWIGFDNFSRLSDDPAFLRSLIVTVIYTLVSVPLQTVIALLIAEAVARRFRNFFGRMVRSILFVPVVASLVVTAVVWRALLGAEGGLVNTALESLGSDTLNILGDPTGALGAVILVTVWKNIGYFLVIYFAGVMAVPRDLYEASAMDGAGYWQQLWSVTVPSLRPITLLVTILGTIWSFQVFDLVYVMTGGGPGGSTTTIVMRLYQSGFEDFQMGYASAMAVVLFLVVVIVSVVQRKVLSDD
ncbi:sugar ABC transporter permease [Nocardiopsis nanhaiensis]